MKLAAYARVSILKDKKGLQGQVERLEAYAKAYGHEVEVFKEVVSASGLVDRPVFEEVMDLVLGDGYEGLLVDSLDRFGRSLRHIIEEAEALQTAGKELVVIRQHIDTSTKEGRLLFHLLGAIAQFEREMIRERLELGKERAREQGQKFGRRIAWLPIERIVEYYEMGISSYQLAKEFGMCHKTILRHIEWFKAGEYPWEHRQTPPKDEKRSLEGVDSQNVRDWLKGRGNRCPKIPMRKRTAYQRKVLDLRLEGRTYKEIGKALGIHLVTAYKLATEVNATGRGWWWRAKIALDKLQEEGV